MTGKIPDGLNSEQWVQFLQNTAGLEGESEVTGKLEAAGSSFKVTVRKAGSGQPQEVSVDAILERSMQFFSGTEAEDPGAELKKRDIVAGLSSLKDRMRSIVEGKEGSHLFLGEIFAVEDTIADLQPVSMEVEQSPKEQLIELTSKGKLQMSDLGKAQDIIEGDRNQLFGLSDYGESFFDFTKAISPPKFQQALAKDVIWHGEELKPIHLKQFQKILFSQADGSSLFEELMKREEGNLIFDRLAPLLDEDDLNENTMWKSQVLNFAYSPERYAHIFLDDDSVGKPEMSRLAASAESWKISTEGTIEESFGSGSKRSKFETWRIQVMSSSTTIAAKPGRSSPSSDRWVKAQQYLSERSVSDRKSEKNVSFDMICRAHELLARGEEDVQHPGELRKGIVRTSGGWTALYPPAKFLQKNIDSFMEWFNRDLQLCEQGKKSPVLHAAQTYQRLVSLHPFENGNGRVSRLMMGYVLERFQIPPPVLGKEILDGVFPLRKKQEHSAFLSKIMDGIEASRKALLS